jgi:antitoxin ParD1/3/4
LVQFETLQTTCRFSRSAASARAADLAFQILSHVDCAGVCLTKRFISDERWPQLIAVRSELYTEEALDAVLGVGFNPIDARRLTVRTTRQLSITLPNDMADALRDRVRAGEYASESEVIREGLRALFARDQAVEAWLQTEVVAAYDAVVADPTRAVSAQAVRARLAAEQTGSV